jgi:hypothetical protein
MMAHTQSVKVLDEGIFDWFAPTKCEGRERKEKRKYKKGKHDTLDCSSRKPNDPRFAEKRAL